MTSDITVTDNSRAIDITAANTTLDLNGFTVSGPVTCTGTGAAVACSADASDVGIRIHTVRGVEVRNGVVTGFEIGISTFGPSDGVRLIDLRAVGHREAGISLANATDSSVIRVMAIHNGNIGMDLGQTHVVDSEASGNSAFGGPFRLQRRHLHPRIRRLGGWSTGGA